MHLIINLQYFTRKFTQKYILRHVDLPADDVQVSFKKGYAVEVRMIMSKGKNAGAQMTTNWRAVVEKTNMHENDIFMFWFRIRSCGGLRCCVRKLI
jgi:hypothetical protein